MYLYGDWHNQVHGWNAVDVRNSDGSLQHGKVINVVENGLIIDFDCPKQYSQFIEYERIFDCSIEEDEYWASPDLKGADIQGLIRLRPNGSWIWLPGKLLDYFLFESDSVLYGYVELQMGSSTVNELLHCSQIRVPPAAGEMEKRCITKEHFVVRSGALPSGYWGSMSSAGSEMFALNIEERRNARPLHILSETVVYLQRRDHEPVTGDQLEWSFDHAEKNPSIDQVRWLHRREIPKKTSRKERQLPNTLTLILPPELLNEIFQHLNSVSRIRCRRSCKLWNAILTDEVLFKDIIVSLKEPDFSATPFSTDWNPLYAVTGCLLKCFTQCTETLLVLKMKAFFHDDTPILIQRMLENKRIKTLVLSDAEFVYEDLKMMEVIDCIMELYSGIKASCDIVVWKDCKVTLCNVTFPVPCASVKLDAADLTTDLWNLLERAMPTPDLQRMQSKLASYVATSKVSHAVWVLNEFQKDDPRPNVHYFGYKWTEENFKELDITKLTKTTLCQLEAYKTSRSPVIHSE